MNEIFDFQTIREAAQSIGVPHSRIRDWQKKGLVPGFYSGSRYYVDVNRLREKLASGDFAKAAPEAREGA